MTITEFNASLQLTQPPADLSPALEALWWDAKEEWNRAHDIAQDIRDNAGSWIHAYLHRKEGDNLNAEYWYDRAGKHMPPVPLQEEWHQITAELLSASAK
ncbi:hypothetical protein LX64_04372 [Chitinophaga skermanii]|uniref:Uncharacterized protein n=1 Tax=Chitinophaga skermanii TaxID=331697 RepID=A0A327Q5W9_9BACT|nr:hypothetical protein [Chitinophaga skermanii]RAI99819.1 hypothetical protein LX64_04372 [Chitinophaga skermanii]